jgi:hypothetical protein
MTLSISDTQHNNTLAYAECHCAECRVLLTIMLSVIMLSVFALCIECRYAECRYAEYHSAIRLYLVEVTVHDGC